MPCGLWGSDPHVVDPCPPVGDLPGSNSHNIGVQALNRYLLAKSLQGSGALCMHSQSCTLYGYHQPLIAEVRATQGVNAPAWAETAPKLGRDGDVV